MLRVITDPELDLAQATAAPTEAALRNLTPSVAGLAWIIGPVAPRTVGRADSPQARIHFEGASADLVLEVRNEQAAAAPVVILASPLRTTRGPAWRVEANPRTVIIPPNEVRGLVVHLRADEATPPGLYDAELRLLGADQAVIRIV